ncbi:ribosomal protein L7/L12 [Actinoplanes oblitus]|uniref:Ribosomal protein L7/L12 n=1 Tax=Actinoplanes oblitus TaxID=3040509 RepID=A0ABY8WSI6_9ACTN|nr:ribosomal protein L7/L12 [Actinoplanes oblitus]WIM99762.1 ribosomal protein L7/L12 [Actinoplanes oblitus]
MEWIVPFAALLPLMLVVLVVAIGRRSAVDHRVHRLAAIERKLDLIMAHLGIHEPEPDVPGMVLQELLAGRKIQAIKEYREATGAGLKEAKDAVELLARQRGLG